MGLDINGVKLLLHAKQLEVNYSKVVTIGRQIISVKEKELKHLLIQAGVIDSDNGADLKAISYAEPFFKMLGAEITDSLDASAYEEATIIHDLNTPIPKDMASKYSLVIDGGSLEHVFNFPTAIKNCMELIEVNGYYIGITPANNYLGHGFYQFSPELYYRIFCEANGFRMLKMYLYADRKKATFYEVKDPLDIKQRVIMANSYPSYLFILAQKTKEKKVFDVIPQQSDYEHIVWKTTGDNRHSNRKFGKFTKLKLKLTDSCKRRTRSLGNSNPQHVRKTDLNLPVRK